MRCLSFSLALLTLVNSLVGNLEVVTGVKLETFVSDWSWDGALRQRMCSRHRFRWPLGTFASDMAGHTSNVGVLEVSKLRAQV